MAIVDVVKYNGSPDVFAWKYPNAELGTWTQLIVNESQIAIFFKGGQALDIFGPGRHTLSTNNIPLLSKLVNLPFGGRSPFAAEVWFINQVHSLEIKWGTPTAIQLQDPKFGVFVPVRAFGQFGIRIDEPKKFLIKLVGTLPLFDTQNITNYFRGLYVTKVKDSLASYLIKKQIGTLEINAYIDELSSFMKERIEPTLNEYGIKLLNFYVNDISIPEDDPTVIQLKNALAKRAEMSIIGYSYQQERSFDTLEAAASNEGAGSSQFMGMGMGLGMGVGLGGAVGSQFGGMAKNINTNAVNPAVVQEPMIKCDACGHSYPSKSKFCPECGDRYCPCPKCGADLPDGTLKCSCGYEKIPPCPSCGAEVPSKDVNFCTECGSSLVRKCPKCDIVIEGSPKFCPGCGGKMEGGEGA